MIPTFGYSQKTEQADGDKGEELHDCWLFYKD